MTKEIQRVLKPGGWYFAISYGNPESRSVHFQRAHLNWYFVHNIIEGGNLSTHYIYMAMKEEGSEAVCAEHYDAVIEELLKEDEQW